MKDPKNWLLVALIGYGLLFTFWNVDDRETIQSLKLEKEQAQRHIKKQIDSVNRVIKRKDEQLLKAMRESAEADLIAKESAEKAEKYRKRYEAVKFVAHDSDSAFESAIRATLKKANHQ